VQLLLRVPVYLGDPGGHLLREATTRKRKESFPVKIPSDSPMCLSAEKSFGIAYRRARGRATTTRLR